MTQTPDTWIALLRAIGGATHAKMSMADLRAACEERGLTQVRTLLATGNLVFSSPLPEADLAVLLRQIVDSFGLDCDVFLRRPADLAAILSLNPLSDASAERPSRMLVHFMASAPDPEHAKAAENQGGPETMHIHGCEAYIDYQDGVGTSKLTPARLERLLGQRCTGRNWNTVQKLLAAAGA